MMRVVLISVILCWVLGPCNAQNGSSVDVLMYVNQLIGGDGSGGNVFVGASLPYGMAKAVADVSGANTAGFSADGSNITGFSHQHDSGTGGNPSLGQFPLFPQYCPDDELNNCKFLKLDRAVNYASESLKTSPGYFALALANGIKAEMTTTQRTALYHFTFPPAKTSNGSAISPLIQLDLTDLKDSRQNASVKVEDNGRISGNGTFIPSFGEGSFMSYYCVDFSGAAIRDTGIYVNNRAGNEPKELFVVRGINLFYIQAGGFVRFRPSETNTISARVGVSFISADKACQNAENEIPGSEWDFDLVKKNAEDAWRSKLSVISIAPGDASDDMQTIFWSAIYRTMLSPQNSTGENPLWQSSEPYFDSFYCLWDSFRTQFPFLTIIDPTTVSSMIRSLLDIYKNSGWLPDCHMSLCKGFTQGGSNADVVIADAHLKNISGIDWNLAWDAVVNDAENEPFDWAVQGRGGLMSWKALNYIPALDYDYLGFGTNSRSVSRTLEYSYDDFCIANLGKALGKDYGKYLARSNNWQNIFKPDQKSTINGSDTGFTGFFQPKYLNKTWGYQDPIACSPLTGFCSLTSNPAETFETSIWEYQFFVPHDMSTLIDLLGGPSTFISRLDYLFASGLSDVSNEISFLTAFLYHYVGRPGLSAQRIRSYFPSRFNASPSGLPGNDDSGAMSAFVAFVMSGLFPNAGQDAYLIIPPFFQEISYKTPGGDGNATIRCTNFELASNGTQKVYIRSTRLNGEDYTRNWIGHEFFSQGMTLEITLGTAESDWGTKAEDLPPSSAVGSMSI